MVAIRSFWITTEGGSGSEIAAVNGLDDLTSRGRPRISDGSELEISRHCYAIGAGSVARRGDSGGVKRPPVVYRNLVGVSARGGVSPRRGWYGGVRGIVLGKGVQGATTICSAELRSVVNSIDRGLALAGHHVVSSTSCL